MSNIATTIEQSRKLVELGLDPKTADMTYEGTQLKVGLDSAITGNLFSFRNGYVIPAWSLSALLEVMPKGTELVKMQSDAYAPYYEIDYMYTGYEDSDPITAAYEMVCWLLERGLIEKGGNNENPHRHP